MAKPLADLIENLLPQTQCSKCGYPSCRAYAVAIERDEAGINQCPPGGAEGIARLADLLGVAPTELSPLHGAECLRRVARIDESLCIGCTRCIKSCPVDAIIGASRQMHSVITEQCTGCDLCIASCPVDCILMTVEGGAGTGWAAWSHEQAAAARERHDFRIFRLQRDKIESDALLAAKTGEALDSVKPKPAIDGKTAEERKKSIIQAALRQARLKRESLAKRAAAGGTAPVTTETE